MNARILILILAVGAGFGLGALVVTQLATDEPSAGGTLQRPAESVVERLAQGGAGELDPEQVAQVVETLIRILDEEIAERHVLAEQLEGLQSEMTDLQENLRARVEAAFSDARNEASANTGNTSPSEQSNQAGQTIEGRLAAAGITPRQVESIRRGEAVAQMRQIDLDDRARREGWLNTPRYYEEFRNLASRADIARRELGDDGYDRYLHAMGQPNRLAVGSIVATSPAERAGLQPGDVILRYGGERVFSSEQLVELRSGGVRGESVVVEIVRNGNLIQITMPRGPMGVQTRPDVVDPDGPGG